jgi:hypothetical protein
MLKAAGATAVLNRELGRLGGSYLSLDNSSRLAVRAVDGVGSSSRRAGSQIDSLSGRVSILADLLLTLGPAAIPLGAVLIPALTTASAALGAVVLGAGSMAIAFGGVGEALTTMNDARLEPTVENLKEAEEAMNRLAPAAQEFVRQLDSMRGLGAQIRDAGAEALFPGLTAALDTLESRGPDAVRIITGINSELGDIAEDSAASLASERWDDFFKMLERETPRTLDPLSRTIGDVVHGVSELMEAFAPLNRDGMDWLADGADGFDKWATGLKRTDGFKDFVSYIRETGPEVAETLSAVGGATVSLVEAAAPLGGPALNAIETFADAVKLVADSDYATPLLAGIAAMRVINRLAPVTAASMALVTGVAGKGGKAAKGAASTAASSGGKTRGGMGGAGALNAIPFIPLLDQMLEGNSIVDASGAAGEASRKWVLDLFVDADTKIAENKFDWLDAEIARLSGKEIKIGADGRDASKEVSFVDSEIKRLKDKDVKLGANNGPAKEKIRQAEDWLFRFAGMNGKATADADNQPARKKIGDAGDWLLGWGRKRAAAKVDADDRRAQQVMDHVMHGLRGIDSTRAEATLDANYSPAQSAIAQLRASLASIPDEIVYIRAVRTGPGGQRAGYDGGMDGGMPFGGKIRRAAAGEMVPDSGLGYADRYLYLLADREHIVTNRNGEADRNRAELEAANRGAKLAVVGAYADGGRVGTRAASFYATSQTVTIPAPSLSDRDVARIAAAVREGTYAGSLAGSSGRVEAGIADYDARQSARARTRYGG